MFKLKQYQQDALDALACFLEKCRSHSVIDAFDFATRQFNVAAANYREYSFGQIPYVCLRLPTGGGKTVLASHAVKVATRCYLEQDYPIVLWLVPTTTIREQTLDALKQPGHPYREELDRTFDHQVKVLNIDEVEQIRPQDIGSKAIIVVSTIANLRVTDTSGRKVYAYHENFEPHFAKIYPNDTRLEKVEEKDLKENGLSQADLGKVKFSFANLLALHKPMIIVDEAHNARTTLTFETLQRIHPACIIEFSATPDISDSSASNVLYHVSASELKAEQMIKLPIMLTEHSDWQASVRDAVLTRTQLAKESQKETDYIRPIVLFQAEAKNGEVTVEVLKQHLIDELKIDESKIAIATGKQKELDGIDLFDQRCPIEYIITIEALKEGWDCSFAYVFCSVKEVKSAKDAEQLLGRVLRMPYAVRRQTEALNRAYAHLASHSFSQAAQQLTDHLVNMGFEAMEVAANLQPGHTPGQADMFAGPDVANIAPPVEPPLELELPNEPSLPEQHKTSVQILPTTGGKYQVKINGLIDEELAKVLLADIKGTEKREQQARIDQHNARHEASQSPSQRRVLFRALPQLCYREQGQLALLEPESFRYLNGDWSLLDYPVELPGFAIKETETTFEVDMEGERISYHVAEESARYDLNRVASEFTETDIIGWLAQEVRQPDISHKEIVGYLSRLITYLTKDRNIPITALVRLKFILAKAVHKQIAVTRNKVAQECFQQLLFGGSNSTEASFDYSYTFIAGLYPARPPFYNGRYKFNKHYYPMIEDLKESDNPDSEFKCAKALDRHTKVKHWIRNLVRREQASFKLPLAVDWFYPDFVAELNDGRLLVVEYKGEGYKTTDDSREKKAIGELWAKSSNGNCVFLFAVESDEKGRDVFAQIEAALA
jgi:type III restriction enzyme